MTQQFDMFGQYSGVIDSIPGYSVLRDYSTESLPPSLTSQIWFDDLLRCVVLDAILLPSAVVLGLCFAVLHPRSTRNCFFYGDVLFNFFYFALVSVLAVDASTRLYTDVQTRWAGVCWSAYTLGIVQVGRHIVHMPYLLCLKWSNVPLYTLHHTIVIYVYGCGVHRQQCVFWGCLLALCEISNFPLTILDGLNSLDSHTPGLLHRFCDGFFKVSYVLFRLVLYPVMLAWFYTDVYRQPAATWEQVSAVERWAYPAAAVFVLSLSLYWALFPPSKPTETGTPVGKKQS